MKSEGISSIRLKRPKWSLKTSFWGAVGVVTVAALCTLLVLKRSLWVELHILAGFLAMFMFGYLFLVLYYGVRFDRNEQYSFSWPISKFETWWDATSQFNTGGTLTEGGAEAGPLGIIIGFLLDLLVSIIISFVIAVVLWLTFSFVVTAILVVAIPLFFLFRRSIRYIVANGRLCRGNLGRSVVFALRATLTNIVWFYAILVGAQYITGFKAVLG
jgi:hypothetical protein